MATSQNTPAQNKSYFIYLLVAVVFLIIVAVAGFLLQKKSSEELIPIQEPGKTEVGGMLIPDFPELPVYPGATTISSYKKQEGEKVGFEANWEADASVSEVMVWYINALREADWVFEEEPVVDETSEQFLIAAKDEIRVYLNVEREEGAEKSEISAEFPLQ